MRNYGTVWCSMNRAIICDLDGTLVCNPFWDGSLEHFYANIFDGFTVEWCQILLESLAKHVKILFITARDEKCRHQTEHQLNTWFDFKYELYMRKSGDLRDDFVIKQEYLNILKDKYRILCCIDDNPKNCEMFSQYIPTLQVVKQ